MSVTLDALANGTANPNQSFTFRQMLSGIYSGNAPGIDVVVSGLYNKKNYSEAIYNQQLTGAELADFARWYYNSFVVPTTDSDLRYLFDAKFAVSLLGLLHSKHSFDQATYGSYPTGGIYTQEIRPVTVYASGGTKIETWISNNVTAGWNSSFWDINLKNSASGASDASINLQDNVEMMVFGMADFGASPKLFEAQFQENGSTPTGVKSHSLMFAKGNQNIVMFEQAISIPTNQNYTVDLNFSAAGESTPVAIGIQYVKQSYLQSE